MLKWSVILPGLGIGVIVGMASGLLGIGGGILMVPALVYLWKHNMQMAVGTSLAVMIPSTIAGTLRHSSFGNVDWPVAIMLGVGAMAGAYFLGAPLAEHIPSDMLKKIFGVVMALFGLQMVGAFDWIGGLWK
ncbi:MAG TPA: sulfite exporter TauE/SafE family protein [Armatimonadota bacterium]|jgi:hypothetical protein